MAAEARSLNLAVSVAIAAYEARRQWGDCPDFRVGENGTVPFDADFGRGAGGEGSWP